MNDAERRTACHCILETGFKEILGFAIDAAEYAESDFGPDRKSPAELRKCFHRLHSAAFAYHFVKLTFRHYDPSTAPLVELFRVTTADAQAAMRLIKNYLDKHGLPTDPVPLDADWLRSRIDEEPGSQRLQDLVPAAVDIALRIRDRLRESRTQFEALGYEIR